MKTYKKYLELNDDRFLIRLIDDDDCDSLLEVYSDKMALPFFNSDNCDGDNFYYDTKEKMIEALNFWKLAYERGWFVRLSIIDKSISKAIGTIELCLRTSDDNFNNCGILRVDVKSDYERFDMLYDIFFLITPMAKEALGCNSIITKAPIYAVERIKALEEIGFIKSNNLMIGKNGILYYDYWVID